MKAYLQVFLNRLTEASVIQTVPIPRIQAEAIQVTAMAQILTVIFRATVHRSAGVQTAVNLTALLIRTLRVLHLLDQFQTVKDQPLRTALQKAKLQLPELLTLSH